MRALTPLSSIYVPPPLPPEHYRLSYQGNEYSFYGLKALLGAADLSKAGDRNAGLAPSSCLLYTSPILVQVRPYARSPSSAGITYEI